MEIYELNTDIQTLTGSLNETNSESLKKSGEQEIDGSLSILDDYPKFTFYKEINGEKKVLGKISVDDTDDNGVMIESDCDEQGRRAILRIARGFGIGMLLEGVEKWDSPIGFKCTITRNAPEGFGSYVFSGVNQGLYNAIDLARRFSFHLRFFISGSEEIDIHETEISGDTYFCYYTYQNRDYVIEVDNTDAYKVYCLSVVVDGNYGVSFNRPGVSAATEDLYGVLNHIYARALNFSVRFSALSPAYIWKTNDTGSFRLAYSDYNFDIGTEIPYQCEVDSGNNATVKLSHDYLLLEGLQWFTPGHIDYDEAIFNRVISAYKNGRKIRILGSTGTSDVIFISGDDLYNPTWVGLWYYGVHYNGHFNLHMTYLRSSGFDVTVYEGEYPLALMNNTEKWN